jgi:hypothetical protein
VLVEPPREWRQMLRQVSSLPPQLSHRGHRRSCASAGGATARVAPDAAPGELPSPAISHVMMLPSSAHAEKTTLPEVDTKCTAPSLIPTVIR